MKVIEILLKQFESFIKRAFMPSISFVFIFTVIGIISIRIFSSKNVPLKFDIGTIDINSNTWYFLLIFMIGLSFFLSILTQVIYDNLLKWNFDLFCYPSKKSLLYKYRILVIMKLKVEENYPFKLIVKDSNYTFKKIHNKEFTDNNLYQVIGRKLSYYTNNTNTTRYVDDAKSMGIFFISIILSLLIWAYIYDYWLYNLYAVIIGLIGYEIIKAKYRSRALRMYVNYLLGENEKVKEETKNCTTFICKEETKPN